MTGVAEEKAKYLSVASTLPEDKEKLISRVIGAAIEVHRQLVPGFLESIYERALCYELESLGIPFEKEVEILVRYKEIAIPGQRLDLVIDNFLILELKAIEHILPIHEAQLLSYMKSTGLKLGLLINFNVKQLKSGIRRMVMYVFQRMRNCFPNICAYARNFVSSFFLRALRG